MNRYGLKITRCINGFNDGTIGINGFNEGTIGINEIT